MSHPSSETGTTLTEVTAEEAASMIGNGEIVAFSGFTPAGAPKAVPRAIAKKARQEHKENREYKIGVITGASTGKSLDGELAAADAILFRTPYQSDPTLRARINAGQTRFFDLHLSTLSQHLRYGFLGPIKWAVIEACSVSDDGEIVLTTAVGASPTFCHLAEKIIIELNEYHPESLRGLHDIYEPADPPHRREFPIYSPADRIGETTIKVDPNKIVGIVRTNEADEVRQFNESDETTNRIGKHVAGFIAAEIKAGRLPATMLPVQSGVGNIANAVLRAMGNNPNLPPFAMYSEVIQDAVIELIASGRISFASGVSLTVSPEKLQEIYQELDFYQSRLLLRPQEVSNQPEIVRRLGVITINTALEVDLFGNVNSTHILGNNLMNGIGGSADFTRNAYLSIFTAPSTAKGGRISTIVPLCSHLDHSEHSVHIIVTEQGVADLRNKDPKERAREIVDKCAHPDYRDELHTYFDKVEQGHTPQTLAKAFAMHIAYMKEGDMRGLDLSDEN